jgi:release factor glutamine methyltransferase
LKKSREYLFTYPEKKLTNLQPRPRSAKRGGLKTYKLITNRRARHEPIAYITGHKEFFGLNFLVNKNTLIPRPETEMLVEEALQQIGQSTSQQFNHLTIVDIGTGSGAIAIAVAKNCPLACPATAVVKGGLRGIKFYATDYSPLALKLARQNARRLLPPLSKGAEGIHFLRGDLLSPILKSKILKPVLSLSKDLKPVLPVHRSASVGGSQVEGSSILLSNLPYLTTKEWQSSAPEMKKYEPRSALDGGQDGMKYLNTLFVQLKTYNLQPQTILLEIGWRQGSKIKLLARKYLPEYNVIIKKDLAGFDRLAILSWRRT